MNINITSVHFNVDQKLVDFTNKKIGKLEKFHGKITDVQVIFRVEVQGNKITEVKLMIPNHQLFAKDKSSSFEKGIDSCAEALKRQIKKIKTQTQKK